MLRFFLVNDPATLVEGSERLTCIFGYWPSFHDAEVIDLHFWRGDGQFETAYGVFPILTATFYVFSTVRDASVPSGLTTQHETLVTLRFHALHQFRMDGFEFQNEIYGLDIRAEEPQAGLPNLLRVEFEAGSSMAATFHCTRIEVLRAEPWSPPARTV